MSRTILQNSLAEVEDRIRRHQSVGRVLLAKMLGADKLEVAGDGVWVVDDQGQRFFDAGSFSIFLFGHRPPRIIAALLAALDEPELDPDDLAEQAEASLKRWLGPAFKAVTLARSGAEAVEISLDLAARHTGRRGVAHLQGSFHGKTMGALSITDSDVFKAPIGPLLGDVMQLPRDDPEGAYDMILRRPPACVFVEPIQGEGGAWELSPELLGAVRAACDRVGALMISDEIQCGLGRSGTALAVSPSGVMPDVLLLGKALGGGIAPVSAVATRGDQASQGVERPALLPLSAIAVAAVVEELFAFDLGARATSLGEALRQDLSELVDDHGDLLSERRGRGLLQGLAFRKADAAGEFVKASLKHGVLTTPCFTAPNVVRITPPVRATHQDLTYLRQAFIAALGEVDRP